MKITTIKQQVKQPDRVSVFLDGKYVFSLTLDQLLHECLKKGDELPEQEIERLKKISLEGKIKMRALEWVLGRPHSVKEFMDYCRRKKIDDDLAGVMCAEFMDRKYLDDAVFAEWFSENRARKNRSSRQILSELAAKGVSGETARGAAKKHAQDTNALVALIAKLRSKPRYADEQKLIAYLVRKGFSYQDVKTQLQLDDEDS